MGMGDSRRNIFLIALLLLFLALMIGMILFLKSIAWIDNMSTQQEMEIEIDCFDDDLGDGTTYLEIPQTTALSEVRVSGLRFESSSFEQITLSWPDNTDSLVREYILMRRNVSGEDKTWHILALISSDGINSGDDNAFIDMLDVSVATQYLYRMDVRPNDETHYFPGPGNQVIASNVCVCIDPGHYKDSSHLQGENLYGYNEGNFVLQIGLLLRDMLKEDYGIYSRMTRDSDHIRLSGFSDSELDQIHLALRGEYAQGCTLFISLHTNANQDHANGYETCSQPINITKTIVLLNRPASVSQENLTQANAIGQKLSYQNAERGLATVSSFITADQNTVRVWTDEYNDALDMSGTVCVRWGEQGEDYYGVLRGAAAVGVPGMIVEHAHHTVPEIRQAAAQGGLANAWARADADGIAEGYGFRAMSAIS